MNAGIEPPRLIATSEFTRCHCPKCKRLDRKFPGEGYQLALLPYVVSLPKVQPLDANTKVRQIAVARGAGHATNDHS
jgi:hypothetical protein